MVGPDRLIWALTRRRGEEENYMAKIRRIANTISEKDDWNHTYTTKGGSSVQYREGPFGVIENLMWPKGIFWCHAPMAVGNAHFSL